MSCFSEYTEEVNDTTMYGVYYKHMMSTPVMQTSDITPIIEERVTLVLKMDAINSIKEQMNNEYYLLKKQYDSINIERKELK